MSNSLANNFVTFSKPNQFRVDPTELLTQSQNLQRSNPPHTHTTPHSPSQASPTNSHQYHNPFRPTLPHNPTQPTKRFLSRLLSLHKTLFTKLHRRLILFVYIRSITFGGDLSKTDGRPSALTATSDESSRYAKMGGCH